MESLGPGELKYGITQAFFFVSNSSCRHTLLSGKTHLESSDLKRLKYGISQAVRGAEAWRSPGHDKGPSSELCYLEIRLLSLIMAFRPHPEMVKLKYGITQTPLSGETQVWNPSYGPGELKYGITQALFLSPSSWVTLSLSEQGPLHPFWVI